MKRIGIDLSLGARLHCDREAALAPVFGFILLFFAWGMAAILNTGQVTYDKVRVQNTADAIALAQAEQAARDLNTMSMNNLALSQMLAVSAVSFTLVEVITEIEARAIAAQAEIAESAAEKCEGPPPWVAACLAIHAVPAGQVLSVQIQTGALFTRYRPDKGFSTSQRLIVAFNRMNEYLVNSFPRRAGALSQELLRQDKAGAVFVYPPCKRRTGSDCQGSLNEGGDLPLGKDGGQSIAAYQEVCAREEHGSDGLNFLDFNQHGYPSGKGPYTAGGSASRPKLRDHVNHETRLSDLLPFFNESTMKAWDWLIDFTTPPEYQDEQSAEDNAFLKAMDRNWSIVCGPAGGLTAGLLGQVFNLPEPFWLTGRPLAAALVPAAGMALFDTKTLNYLVIVAQDRGERFNPEDFRERDDPYYAYAQAMLYNPKAFDLYTSRWKAKLVPASFMDKPDAVAEAISSQSGNNQFNLLARIIQSDRGDQDWANVNTH